MKKIFVLFVAGCLLTTALSCAFQIQPSSEAAGGQEKAAEQPEPADSDGTDPAADETAGDGVAFSDSDFFGADDAVVDAVIDDEVDPTLIPLVRDWTFIVYMAADNNLESAAIADFNELESVDFAAHNMTTLVLFDRADGYDATNGNWTDTRLFNVTYDAEKTNTIVSEQLACADLGLSLDTPTELDMANNHTLSALISFAAREYPAEHYGLIVWGHGTGWRGGGEREGAPEPLRAFAVDDFSASYMTIAALRTGIESGLESIEDTDRLDVIGFDTCFGICMETAYECKDCAIALAGTPALVPESGWDYAALFSAFVAGEKTLSAWCDCALAQYRAQYAYYGYASFSVVDCAAMEAAVAAFDAFAKACAATITDAETKAAYRTIFQTQVDAYFAASYKCDFYVDVYSLARAVSAYDGTVAASAENLQAALERAIPTAWNAHAEASPHPMGVFYAVYLADGVPEVPLPSAYVFGSRVAEQSLFVQECTQYVPTALGSGSLLDKLFYTSF